MVEDASCVCMSVYVCMLKKLIKHKGCDLRLGSRQ